MSPRRVTPTRLRRKIAPGTRREEGAGAELRCLLLARRPEEWIALDLASAAFVRLEHPGPEAPRNARPGRSVLAFTLAAPEEPSDPARPEAVRAEGEITVLAPPRRRRQRRLLDSLAQPDRAGATLLGTRGPSLAYVDLDGRAGSLVLIRAGSDLELMAKGEDEVLASVTFGGMTQLLPVGDAPAQRSALVASPRSLSGAPLAAALGYRPGYLLVGLDGVEAGHVKKSVLAVLAR